MIFDEELRILYEKFMIFNEELMIFWLPGRLPGRLPGGSQEAPREDIKSLS